jgi:hypothetical protein
MTWTYVRGSKFEEAGSRAPHVCTVHHNHASLNGGLGSSEKCTQNISRNKWKEWVSNTWRYQTVANNTEVEM